MINGIKISLISLPISLLFTGKLIFLIGLSFFPVTIPSLGVIYSIIFLSFFTYCSVRGNIICKLRGVNVNVVLFWFFFLFTIPSLFYTGVYLPLVEEKIVLILYNIVCPIIMLNLINVIHPIKYESLSYYLVLVSRITIIVSALALLGGAYKYVDDGTRLLLNGVENTIWLSRYLSLAVFCCLYLHKGYLKPLHWLLALIGIYLMFESGSRGPIISLILSLGIPIWKNNRRLFYWVFILFFLCLLGALIFFKSRALNFDLANDYSALERLSYFAKLFESKIDPLWGFGLGNFGWIILNATERVYPHNIFLEIFFEIGIFPTLIFIYLLIKTFQTKYKNAIYFLFFISFMNSNFSGDLAGNADLFIFMYFLLKFNSNEDNSIPKFT